MAEYTLESFKDCLFNPLHKDVLKKYPVLSEVSTNERLLKYILCLYDPKSPLIRDYRNNVANRKREAARLAGYDLFKDVKFLEDLYSFQNKIAASSAIVFLREHIHNMLWTMIVSHEQTFYEYNERLLKPVEDALSYTSINKEGREEETSVDVKEKDIMSTVSMKSKLIDDCKKIYNLLTEYYEKMFEDKELREQVVVSRITPESMARV